MANIRMTKVALFYALEKEDPSTRTMIHRELYGYKDISNHGKYTYKRKGILETVRHKKLLGSMLMLKQKDVAKFIKIFKKYHIVHYVFEVK
jgi:hypothetical protein